MCYLKKLFVILIFLFSLPANVFTATLAHAENVTVTVDPLSTYDRTPALSGTISDPLAEVDVYIEGNGWQAENKGDGTWVMPDNILSSLSDGIYDVMVMAIRDDADASYTIFDSSVDELYIFDNFTPTPVLDPLLPITLSNVSNYNVSGFAEEDSTIIMNFNDGFNPPVNINGSTMSNGYFYFDGTTIVPPKIDLSTLWDGNIALSIIMIDTSGNQNEDFKATIVKNTGTLLPPNISMSPQINQRNHNSFSVSGTGVENGTLYYYFTDEIGKTVSGTTPIDSSGTFSGNIMLSTLADGNITATFFQKSQTGDSSGAFMNELTKDVLIPQAPFLDITNVDKTNQSNYRIFGVAEPYSIIRYMIGIGLHSKEGVVATGGNGYFETYVPLNDFPDGNISLVLHAEDATGNLSPTVAKTIVKDTSNIVDPVVVPVPEVIIETKIDQNNQKNVALSVLTEPFFNFYYSITDSIGNILSGMLVADQEGKISTVLDLSSLKDGLINFSSFVKDLCSNASEEIEIVLTKDTAIPEENVVTPTTPSKTTTVTANSTVSTSPIGTTLPEAGVDFIQMLGIIYLSSILFSFCIHKISARKN